MLKQRLFNKSNKLPNKWHKSLKPIKHWIDQYVYEIEKNIYVYITIIDGVRDLARIFLFLKQKEF